MSGVRFLTFHYTLRHPGGAMLDTSRGGEPLSCLEGAGQIVDGLEAVLHAMQPGEKRSVVVPPERGYGVREAALIQRVPRASLPVEEIRVGDRFQTGPEPSDPIVTVLAVEGQEVLLDANHPLAGQPLHFEVELVTARAARPDEPAVAGGHP